MDSINKTRKGRLPTSCSCARAADGNSGSNDMGTLETIQKTLDDLIRFYESHAPSFVHSLHAPPSAKPVEESEAMPIENEDLNDKNIQLLEALKALSRYTA